MSHTLKAWLLCKWRELGLSKYELEFVDEIANVLNQLSRKDAEITRLKRIIAKELTENDDPGAEFVYVNALKEQLAELKAENEEMRTGRYERGFLWNEHVKLRAQFAIAVEALEKANSMMPDQCEESTWPTKTLIEALAKLKGGGV